MKKILVILLLLTIYTMPAKIFFDFSALDIAGDTLDFEIFKGKKILVVNTASECGYTFQFGSLQALYKKYGGENFEIIGFPSNSFNQELDSNEKIDDFCKENYGVTFTMMSKISVGGIDIHPVYQWLTRKSQNGVMDSQVKWNFQKYLINPDGSLHGYYLSSINPMSQEIQDWINDQTNVEMNDDLVKIFPVPAENHINFENLDNFTDYKIIDISGETILEGKTAMLSSLSTFGLTSGTYFIMLSNKNEILSRRIIINK